MGVNDRPPHILYIHGIGNKPPADVLKAQWDAAIAGGSLAGRSRLAYWIDRSRYPTPADSTARCGDLVSVDLPGPLARMGVDQPRSDPRGLLRELTPPGGLPATRRALAMLGARMVARHAAALASANGHPRLLPMPQSMRGWIARQLTRLFLDDAYDFLFDATERARMRSVLSASLDRSAPTVMVAHSLGSLIAYDWLCSDEARGVRVPLLVTFGSPIGLIEVQELMRGWIAPPALAVPPGVDRWINVADRLDPVAADTTIADEITPAGQVVDRVAVCLNEDAPWHPHSATGYLRSEEVREALGACCDLQLSACG